MTATPGPGPAPQVAVLVCEHLADPVEGLRLEKLAERMAAIAPGLPVLVGGGGDSMDAFATAVAGAGAPRLVLGRCDACCALQAPQSALRLAGVDPLAIAQVLLGGSLALPAGAGRERYACRQLSAAAARLAAPAGAAPRRMRRRYDPGARVERRRLFDAFQLQEEAVAEISQERCLGAKRCHLCAEACPVGAVTLRGADSLAIDQGACNACGMCVEVCPADALSLAGESLVEREAEITALLRVEEGEPAPAILFACRHALGSGGSEIRREAALAGEGVMEVRHLGEVTPGWVLQCLGAGAPRVRLLGCGPECGSAWLSTQAPALDFCRACLAGLGDEPPADRIAVQVGSGGAGRSGSARPLPGPATPARLLLHEPRATASALAALAGAAGRPLTVAGRGSPLGLLACDRDLCSVCGVCATVCPTGALDLNASGARASLSWAAVGCSGCGRCVHACPEQALAVRPLADTDRLAEGRRVISERTRDACRRCGAVLSPAQAGGAAGLCPDCRVQLFGLSGRPPAAAGSFPVSRL